MPVPEKTMTTDAPPLDEHGFLIDPDAWNPEVAGSLARMHGVAPLGETHFAIIDALRRHYRRFRAIPPAAHVCLELDLGESCIDELFHGPLNAWQVAGLPNPGEEARVYLDNQTAP
jgi:tRNA 2-thiouridine synthesizing protein E